MNNVKSKNNRISLIIGILITLIVLISSSYAIYRYVKTLDAIGITNKNIIVRYNTGNSQISLNNAYPISDSFAISNLTNLSYIDFSVTGTEGNPSVNYEIYLTEKNGNTLGNNYIKLYLTDENNNVVAGPSLYSSLSATSYTKDASFGKVILTSNIGSNQTKNYRLYAWIDKDFSDNTISRIFNFYVNIYAYKSS